MLVDSSTGLDLNSAGTDLQGVDILWDMPQVISVIRLRFTNGTRIETSYCRLNAEEEDFETARTMLPVRSFPIRGNPSDTLGCGHDDEYTTACWVFE